MEEEEEKKKRSNREKEENMATHTMITGKKRRSRTVINNDEEEEEEKLRPWSDLPQQILELIKKRLFFAGQLTFPAVCKSWSSIDSFPPQNQIPWLIAFEKSYDDKLKINTCKLVDPTSKKTYNIDIDMKAIKEKEKDKDFNTMEVHESKYGWLLISSSEYNRRINRSPRNKTSLFVFSPFYKEKNNLIELPDLHHDYIFYDTLATFTSNPLEEDCLFLIVFALLHMGTVIIHTCRRGDKSWSCLDSYSPVGKQAVRWTRWTYSEGIFYYIEDDYVDYKMGTYDFARKKWSVIPPPVPTTPLPTAASEDFYIVKTDGEEELFLVYVPDLKGYFIRYIYRLDLSSMIWERVNSLGDNVLFIGDGYSSVLKLSEMKMKGISPDMVYYCGNSKLKCFSSVDHYFFYTKQESHQDDDSFDYGSMTTKSCRKIFIDPPPYHHYHHH